MHVENENKVIREIDEVELTNFNPQDILELSIANSFKNYNIHEKVKKEIEDEYSIYTKKVIIEGCPTESKTFSTAVIQMIFERSLYDVLDSPEDVKYYALENGQIKDYPSICSMQEIKSLRSMKVADTKQMNKLFQVVLENGLSSEKESEFYDLLKDNEYIQTKRMEIMMQTYKENNDIICNFKKKALNSYYSDSESNKRNNIFKDMIDYVLVDVSKFIEINFKCGKTFKVFIKPDFDDSDFKSKSKFTISVYRNGTFIDYKRIWQ